jgi:hypothetical protein
LGSDPEFSGSGPQACTTLASNLTIDFPLFVHMATIRSCLAAANLKQGHKRNQTSLDVRAM